jgi:hypothetical protein
MHSVLPLSLLLLSWKTSFLHHRSEFVPDNLLIFLFPHFIKINFHLHPYPIRFILGEFKRAKNAYALREIDKPQRIRWLKMGRSHPTDRVGIELPPRAQNDILQTFGQTIETKLHLGKIDPSASATFIPE